MQLENFIRTRQAEKDILLMTHIVLGYPSFDANLRIIEVMVDAQPRIAAPEMSFWYRTLRSTTNATPDTMNPMIVASRSGSSEKAKKASVAIRISLRGD